MFIFHDKDELEEWMTTVFILSQAENECQILSDWQFNIYIKDTDLPAFPLLVLIKNNKENPTIDDLVFVSEQKICEAFL